MRRPFGLRANGGNSGGGGPGGGFASPTGSSPDGSVCATGPCCSENRHPETASVSLFYSYGAKAVSGSSRCPLGHTAQSQQPPGPRRGGAKSCVRAGRIPRSLPRLRHDRLWTACRTPATSRFLIIDQWLMVGKVVLTLGNPTTMLRATKRAYPEFRENSRPRGASGWQNRKIPKVSRTAPKG